MILIRWTIRIILAALVVVAGYILGGALYSMWY